MKKMFLVLCIALSSVGAFAQNKLTDKISFFDGMKYDFSVGMGTRSASEPFDNAVLSFNLGVDAIKPIKSFKNDKIDLSGFVGLHFVRKGGKQSTDIMDSYNADNKLNVSQLSVPIHVMGSYNLNKCSVFLDFGPYIAFGIGGSDFEELERSGVEFGLGGTVGARFSRLGVSFGLDGGLTSTAKYKGDKIKCLGCYIDLRWYIGKKSKQNKAE